MPLRYEYLEVYFALIPADFFTGTKLGTNIIVGIFNSCVVPQLHRNPEFDSCRPHNSGDWYWAKDMEWFFYKCNWIHTDAGFAFKPGLCCIAGNVVPVHDPIFNQSLFATTSSWWVVN